MIVLRPLEFVNSHSTMRFLVILRVGGLLKFSNDLNFNSKFGRHSFSVNLFISKVIFFVA